MVNGIEIFLLALGASFVQRTTGFGFGIFIMTMLPFLMPSYGEATTLSGLLALTTSITIAIRMRKLVSWKRLCPILAAFIISSAAAICLLSRVEGSLMRQILGIVLIATGLYFAFLRHRIHIGTSPAWQTGAGTLSGIMGGFFGMQGPPAVLYFISSEPDKEHYMAMTQMYFAIGNAGMTVMRSFNGYLTETVGWGYLAGLGGVGAGLLLGSVAFRHIPNRIFSYIVYAYISVSGLIVLLTSL